MNKPFDYNKTTMFGRMHKIGRLGKVMYFSRGDWFLSQKTVEEFNDEVMMRWEREAVSVIEAKLEKRNDSDVKEKIQAKVSRMRKLFLTKTRWRLMSPFDAVESLR